MQTEMANKNSKKIIVRILFCLFLAVFVFSGVMLGRSLLEYKKENDEHSRLEDDFLIFDGTSPSSSGTASATVATTAQTLPLVSDPEESVSSPGTPAQAETTAPPESLSPESTVHTMPRELWPAFSVNWDALEKRNPDVIGWIWMYDSEISYPILLGEDNAEYVHTTIDGEYAKFGSIFADYRSAPDFTDLNTIVYGHNGGYGVKFGGLMNYRLKSHWDSHRYICIMTPSGLSKYYIYSAYTSKSQGNPYRTDFVSEADYRDFLDLTVSASLYQTDMTPTVSDRILTLSTCTNNASDERMIVHGILVN